MNSSTDRRSFIGLAAACVVAALVGQRIPGTQAGLVARAHVSTVPERSQDTSARALPEDRGARPLRARPRDIERQRGATAPVLSRERFVETPFPESWGLDGTKTRLNAAFEDGRTAMETSATPAREIPRDWFVTGLGREHYALSTEREVVWNGSASVELTPIEDAYDVKWGALMQSAMADGFRAKRIEFSAHLQTEAVEGGSGLWFRADDAQGAMVAFDNMSSRMIRENNSWTRYSIVLDIPTHAVSIHYGVIQIGRGSTWADDARIETVDRSIAVTAPPPRDRRRARPTNAVRILSQPGNLDFEETIVISEQESERVDKEREIAGQRDVNAPYSSNTVSGTRKKSVKCLSRSALVDSERQLEARVGVSMEPVARPPYRLRAEQRTGVQRRASRLRPQSC